MTGYSLKDKHKLLEILCDQFVLHELQHHPNIEKPKDRLIVVKPVAHTPIDIYKCLHQAEFGVGHDIHEPEQFNQRLIRELDRATPDSSEPILERISLDETQFRLNLRPYKRLFSGDSVRAASGLTDVCVRSAANKRGDEGHFIQILTAFRDINHDGEITIQGISFRFPPQMVLEFLSEIAYHARRTAMIPVLSHSEPYRQRNHPSYRVVDIMVLKQSELSFITEAQHDTAR